MNLNIYLHRFLADLSNPAWLQSGTNLYGESNSDDIGHAVAFSGDGEILAVRVYAWMGSAWEQMGAGINKEAAGDAFGVSVSLSSNGGVVAIGA